MALQTDRLVVGILDTNCYIVSDGEFTGVIDPGGDVQAIEKMIGERIPSHFILTHTHYDHVAALRDLRKKYPEAKLCFCPKEKTEVSVMKQMTLDAVGESYIEGIDLDYVFDFGCADTDLVEGVRIGPFTVIETPGHTTGSICLLDEKDKIMFSGDTLFLHAFGRTDFLGGSARDIVSSIRKLLALNPEIAVMPGHGCSTTIGCEALYYKLK